MKNKKIIIIIFSSVIALIIIIAVALFIRQKNLKQTLIGEQPVTTQTFQADFLSEKDKKAVDISTDLRVQALKRSPDGDVMVYKIIRSDSDITDPAKIAPISPNLKQ